MKKIQNIFWVIFAIVIISYAIHKIAVNSFTHYFLGSHPEHIKAVVINEKNYEGNQPIRAGFSYSYQFIINGNSYTGNSHDEKVKPGDSIDVEYNIDHPNINRPLNPKR